MGNQISNQNDSTHLSVERVAHREWIGGRALTLLSHYWRDDDPVELTAAIGKDWADVLEGVPQEFIQLACIQYQRENPRKKPTPGSIFEMANALRPKPQLVVPSEEKSELAKQGVDIWDMTPEEKETRRKEAAKIMDGFKIGGAV